MKIDFSQEITNIDGTPFVPHETLRKVCTFVIGVFLPGDDLIPGDKKVALSGLGYDIYKAGGPIDLTFEQISVLKDRIARSFPAPVVARAWEILEGKEQP